MSDPVFVMIAESLNAAADRMEKLAERLRENATEIIEAAEQDASADNGQHSVRAGLRVVE